MILIMILIKYDYDNDIDNDMIILFAFITQSISDIHVNVYTLKCHHICIISIIYL